jgi:hypothetical protein
MNRQKEEMEVLGVRSKVGSMLGREPGFNTDVTFLAYKSVPQAGTASSIPAAKEELHGHCIGGTRRKTE